MARLVLVVRIFPGVLCCVMYFISVGLSSAALLDNSPGWRSGSVYFRKPYSGGTAPDSNRIPHQFPARATGFLEGAALFFAAREV